MHYEATSKGLSLISTIIVAGMLGFIGFVGLRTIPVYSEYFTIKKLLKGVAGRLDSSASDAQVRREFALASIASYNLAVKPDDIEVSRQGGTILVYFNYERVVPLFGNVSLLFKFDPTSR